MEDLRKIKETFFGLAIMFWNKTVRCYGSHNLGGGIVVSIPGNYGPSMKKLSKQKSMDKGQTICQLIPLIFPQLRTQ